MEKVALSRGYYNMRAISDGLAPVFETTSKRMQGKLERGQLTKEECEVIGAYFEMTMKEYYEVFMDGLFQPDAVGHYRCHIENLKEHMKPPEDEEDCYNTLEEAMKVRAERDKASMAKGHEEGFWIVVDEDGKEQAWK